MIFRSSGRQRGVKMEPQVERYDVLKREANKVT